MGPQGQEGWHLRLRTPRKDSELARKRPARHRRLLLHTSFSRKERNQERVITPVNGSSHILEMGAMTRHFLVSQRQGRPHQHIHVSPRSTPSHLKNVLWCSQSVVVCWSATGSLHTLPAPRAARIHNRTTHHVSRVCLLACLSTTHPALGSQGANGVLSPGGRHDIGGVHFHSPSTEPSI